MANLSRKSMVALLALAIAGATANAASPSLGGITPFGVTRGTDTVLFFNGGRLGDAKEIFFYSPGFTVTKLEAVNDNQIKASIKVAADCRMGEHIARVRTATGISEMKTFQVGPFPVVEEKEPNSEFDKPQAIPLNVTVNGRIDSEDVDYFQVAMKKGQRLSVEIEGMRLAQGLFDPYVAILDSKRFELAATDDSPLLGQDACASIVVPEDGNYIVQVRDSAYTGAGYYRLHVGTFPRPLAVVPAGGRPGEELEVTFLGDPTGPIKQKVKLPTAVDHKLALHCQDAGGISPAGVPIRLLDAANVVEGPQVINPRQATVCSVPGAVNGVIGKPGEVDIFRFNAKKGQNFDVHCYGRRLGSALDSVMTLYIVRHDTLIPGDTVVANDDAFGPDSYFRFAAPQDGEYAVAVTDHLGKGGINYFYRIEFTVPEYSANLSIPKVANYSQERQTISVPRGNRYATVINVGRSLWGGECVLGADKLPPGVTMNCENMPANLDSIPVVFEAAANAGLSGELIHLQANPIDPNLKGKVPSKFYQMAELVMGAPGQSIYVKAEVDKVALAVTDEVPFKINIVEPKAPLVQNGSMNLKIVAERKAGFKAPITVQALFNPPGVGSASAVVIPEGQNEVLFPMNANGGAQVRKWKYAVIGSATVGNGPIYAASQLATLEIAAPFVTFAMERAAVEQGKPTEMFCKIQQNTAFTGPAKVTLLGLPNKVVTAPLEITKDTKEIGFKLTTDKASPAGTHRNIFCQVVVMVQGEPVHHNVGGTELRIDVPLPPKVAAAPPPPTPKPMPMPVAQPVKPVEKRLTRLEKLRLEQEEREKALKGGTAPAQPKK